LVESLLVVVVVDEDSPVAGVAAVAEVSAGVDAIADVSAVVVVVVVVVSVVAVVSAFFWQAPRLQARPTASMTATVVRLVIGKSSRCVAVTNTEA
jgi:hypothetical protein